VLDLHKLAKLRQQVMPVRVKRKPSFRLRVRVDLRPRLNLCEPSLDCLSPALQGIAAVVLRGRYPKAVGV